MIDRYSNPGIARIWSLEEKYAIWLEVELAVCRAWQRRGLFTADELLEIEKKAAFDVARILEIENTVQHDVIAFLTNVKEHIGPAGRFVHYGLTSSDLGDTALCLQLVRSIDIIKERLSALIDCVREAALLYKDQVMVGRTHGIHGEPVTLGLKFAHFYAELLRDQERLLRAREVVAVGKFSGAVGTFSNIDPDLEEEVCSILGLKADPVTTQVINRDRHAELMSTVGIVAGSLDHMAQEIRLLQKTEGREVEEPFASGQKGSSAMPHKRNPVICERICGLARVIQSNVQVAYRNMPLWHERDISHSSAERVVLADSLIALDYILTKMIYVVKNLHVYPENMDRVLGLTRGLIFSQRLLLSLIDSGLEREAAYDIVQRLSMQVWEQADRSLRELADQDSEVQERLSAHRLNEVFDIAPFLRNVDAIYQRLRLI
ncbi:MAG: adenylosuccinate lyase [Spirochaetales bacterium]|nr:adenylosuccinate lyase [Spirochaetales bacterium]